MTKQVSLENFRGNTKVREVKMSQILEILVLDIFRRKEARGWEIIPT